MLDEGQVSHIAVCLEDLLADKQSLIAYYRFVGKLQISFSTMTTKFEKEFEDAVECTYGNKNTHTVSPLDLHLMSPSM